MADLRAKAAAIELLLLDVDGVLTDGRVIYADDGVEAKSYHVRDGAGVKLWQAAGKRAAIISGRNAKSVEKRAAELGISIVLQGRHPKDVAYREVLAAAKVTPSQVCVVGDDLMDLPLMRASALSLCPADAVAEVKAFASHTLETRGGRGAVREAVEWLLKFSGAWEGVIAQYQGSA